MHTERKRESPVTIAVSVPLALLINGQPLLSFLFHLIHHFFNQFWTIVYPILVMPPQNMLHFPDFSSGKILGILGFL